jgi:hypothetical protein
MLSQEKLLKVIAEDLRVCRLRRSEIHQSKLAEDVPVS